MLHFQDGDRDVISRKKNAATLWMNTNHLLTPIQQHSAIFWSIVH